MRRFGGIAAMALLLVPLMPRACGVGPTPGTATTMHIYMKIGAYEINRDDRGRERRAKDDLDGLEFEVRINGLADGQPGLKSDRGRTLPWAAAVRTPHIEHIGVTRNAKSILASIHGFFVFSDTQLATMKKTVVYCELYVDAVRKDITSTTIRRNVTSVSCQWHS